MFQVQDDILDLYGDKGREKRGSDIRDGKVSALVVEHIARCPWDAEWLLPLLTRRADTTDAMSTSHRGVPPIVLNACLEFIDQTSRTLLTSSPMSEHRWLPALASEFIALVLTPLRDYERTCYHRGHIMDVNPAWHVLKEHGTSFSQASRFFLRLLLMMLPFSIDFAGRSTMK